MSDIISYGEVIRRAVRRKWPRDDQKQEWYTKLTAARRNKLVSLFQNQEGLCYYCGEQTWLKEPGTQTSSTMNSKKMATLEHILPQAHGGTDRRSNLVMACGYCNGNRGTMSFEYFREVRCDPDKWMAHMVQKAKTLGANDKRRKENSEVRRRVLVGKLVTLGWTLRQLDLDRDVGENDL